MTLPISYIALCGSPDILAFSAVWHSYVQEYKTAPKIRDMMELCGRSKSWVHAVKAEIKDRGLDELLVQHTGPLSNPTQKVTEFVPNQDDLSFITRNRPDIQAAHIDLILGKFQTWYHDKPDRQAEQWGHTFREWCLRQKQLPVIPVAHKLLDREIEAQIGWLQMQARNKYKRGDHQEAKELYARASAIRASH